MSNILHSSESSQYITPPEIMTRVRAVLGEIKLDPATTPLANKIVWASKICCGREHEKNDDGLVVKWTDKWFCNPPYSKHDGGPVNLWTKKALLEQKNHRPEGIMLVNATPDRSWFSDLLDEASAVCLCKKRIRFCESKAAAAKRIAEKIKKKNDHISTEALIDQVASTLDCLGKELPSGIVRAPSPTHGNALFYFGENVFRFIEHIAALGKIIVPKTSSIWVTHI